ncbi:IclR family transcriptional regulator [Planctomycetota bacterium]
MMTKPRISKHLPAQPNQSLAKGIECLQVLATSSKPVGSREMARMLDLEHTGVNRLLGTLAFLGLAEKTPDRKYTPGKAIHVLAALSLRSSNLLSSALPHLNNLSREVQDCNIALGVLWKSYVCYLFFSTPGDPVEQCIASRDPFPAEHSSIGLILLAQKPIKEVKELYRERYNDRLSSQELDTLIARLDQVRTDRYALVNDRTLGAAVGDPAVAGLAIAGDLDNKHIPDLVNTLQKYANLISIDTTPSGL